MKMKDQGGKKRIWRCFLCEKNFCDEDMRGPLLYKERLDEYYVCIPCARDLGLRIIEQEKYMLLQCPGCSRAFLPLLDFDLAEYHSKVLPCPFCKEKGTFKFNLKPEGSVLVELSPESFREKLKNT
jgi:hypothetical protein